MFWRTIRRTSTAHDPFGAAAESPSRGRPDHEPTRVPRPRRGLPDSRAAVGGLLVACATVGTWWITAESGRASPTRYVVAAHPIDPGQPIEAEDLRLAPMALPESVARGAFTDLPAVVGSVALGPIGDGALVQARGIAPSTGTRSGREISFAVETPWAVDGALHAGDRIDVFATSAEGADDATTKVLSNALVRHLSSTGGGLGESTGLTITVAVPVAGDLDGAVSALRVAELTVARATGVTAVESTAGEGSPTAGRGDPIPRSTTTTSAPNRSPRPGRSVTTTTVPSGAGR